MKAINYFMPKTIDEALNLLSEKKDSVAIVAGGTDLVLEINEGHDKGDNIVDISKIPALKYIEEKDGVIHVGAMTTFGEIEQSDLIQSHAKALWLAAYHVGSPQIRNLGTIGGNVVNASVAGDSPTAFMALDAKVLLKSKAGDRSLTIQEFNKEKSQGSIIEKDELLVEVFFDKPQGNTAFAKLAKRDSLAIVVVGTACLIEKDANNLCTKAHIVMGAVSPHPLRLSAIEQALIGKEVTQETLYATLDMYTDAVLSISNRPSAAYKRMSVKGMARKMYDQVLADFA